MKTCAYCGRENEDQATKCQECGTDFDLDPDSSEHILKKPGETESAIRAGHPSHHAELS